MQLTIDFLNFIRGVYQNAYMIGNIWQSVTFEQGILGHSLGFSGLSFIP